MDKQYVIDELLRYVPRELLDSGDTEELFGYIIDLNYRGRIPDSMRDYFFELLLTMEEPIFNKVPKITNHVFSYYKQQLQNDAVTGFRIAGTFFNNDPINLLDISNCTEIGAAIFIAATNIYGVKFSPNLSKMGICAFRGAGLKEVYIPGSLKTIEAQTFAKCENLTKVTLNKGLEVIGPAAFAQTAITYIDIPDSVTEIDNNAFALCLNLTSVTLPQKFEEKFKDKTLLFNIFGPRYKVIKFTYR